jgi:hypothetical protein
MSDMLPPGDRVEDALNLQAHQVAGAIYGTILATTVVATSGYDPETVSTSMVIVAVTSAVFYAAHVYSLAVAARMVVKRPLTRVELRSIAIAEWPMLQSSWPILAALLLGVLGIVGRTTAINLAMMVGIGALFTYGFVMGRQENLGWPRILLNAVVTGGFGLVILLLKVLVH